MNALKGQKVGLWAAVVLLIAAAGALFSPAAAFAEEEATASHTIYLYSNYDGECSPEGDVYEVITETCTYAGTGDHACRVELVDYHPSAPEGYVFVGWRLSDGEETYLYTCYVSDEDVRLYAQWEPVFTLTLKAGYDGNDTVLAELSGHSDTQYCEFYLSNYTPERDGYEFIGWALEPDSDTVNSDDPDYYAAYDRNTTLYAQWRALPEHTFKLTLVGEYDGVSKVLKEFESDPTTDSSYYFSWSPSAVDTYRSNYTFKGWTTKPNDKDTLLSSQYGYTAREEATTLYVYWEKEPHYLTYYLEPGSYLYAGTSQDSYLTGGAYDEPYTFIAKDAPEGLKDAEFYAWCDKSTGQIYFPGDEITVTEQSTRLVGLWIEEREITVFYDSKGIALWDRVNPDEYGKVTIPVQQYPADASSVSELTYTITLSDYTPEREGYTFLGWGTDYTDPVAEYVPGSQMPVRANQSRINLVGVWAPNEASAAANASVVVTGNAVDVTVTSTDTLAENAAEGAAANGEDILASYEISGSLAYDAFYMLTFTVGDAYENSSGSVYIQSDDGTVRVKEVTAENGKFNVYMNETAICTLALVRDPNVAVDEGADDEVTKLEATSEDKKVSLVVTGDVANVKVESTQVPAENAASKAEAAGEEILASFEVTGSLAEGESLDLAFEAGEQYKNAKGHVYITHDDGDNETKDVTADANGVVTITITGFSTYTLAMEKDADGSSNGADVDSGSGGAPNDGSGLEDGNGAADNGAGAGNDGANDGTNAPTSGTAGAAGTGANAGANNAAGNGGANSAPGTPAAGGNGTSDGKTNVSATSPQTGVNTGLVAVGTFAATCAAAGVAFALRRRMAE